MRNEILRYWDLLRRIYKFLFNYWKTHVCYTILYFKDLLRYHTYHIIMIKLFFLQLWIKISRLFFRCGILSVFIAIVLLTTMIWAWQRLMVFLGKGIWQQLSPFCCSLSLQHRELARSLVKLVLVNEYEFYKRTSEHSVL